MLKFLGNAFDLDAEAVQRWYAHWIDTGFSAVEAMLEKEGLAGLYCLGDSPGMADICLIPQLVNARRFDCDVRAFPRLTAIAERAAHLDIFRRVHPSAQPDAF